MKHKQSRLIMGAAVSAAALAVALDHTRHPLPQPETGSKSQDAVIILEEGEELPATDNADCGKTDTADGRRDSPCSL